MFILCRRAPGPLLGDYDPGRAQMSREDPSPWLPVLVGGGGSGVWSRALPRSSRTVTLLSWTGEGQGEGEGSLPQGLQRRSGRRAAV